MSGFVCRECGEDLSASVERFYDVDASTGRLVPIDLSCVVTDVHCGCDHHDHETGFVVGPDCQSVIPSDEEMTA